MRFARGGTGNPTSLRLRPPLTFTYLAFKSHIIRSQKQGYQKPGGEGGDFPPPHPHYGTRLKGME